MIGRLQPELPDPCGPPTGRGGKQTSIPEDLRHVCGNLHGWDTEFSPPEPGNHHAIRSHLHTLDIYPPLLTFFQHVLCARPHKKPLLL